MDLQDTKQEDLPVMTNLLNERLVPFVIKGANVLIFLNKCFAMPQTSVSRNIFLSVDLTIGTCGQFPPYALDLILHVRET